MDKISKKKETRSSERCSGKGTTVTREGNSFPKKGTRGGKGAVELDGKNAPDSHDWLNCLRDKPKSPGGFKKNQTVEGSWDNEHEPCLVGSKEVGLSTYRREGRRKESQTKNRQHRRVQRCGTIEVRYQSC